MVLRLCHDCLPLIALWKVELLTERCDCLRRFPWASPDCPSQMWVSPACASSQHCLRACISPEQPPVLNFCKFCEKRQFLVFQSIYLLVSLSILSFFADCLMFFPLILPFPSMCSFVCYWSVRFISILKLTFSASSVMCIFPIMCFQIQIVTLSDTCVYKFKRFL